MAVLYSHDDCHHMHLDVLVQLISRVVTNPGMRDAVEVMSA